MPDGIAASGGHIGTGGMAGNGNRRPREERRPDDVGLGKSVYCTDAAAPVCSVPVTLPPSAMLMRP